MVTTDAQLNLSCLLLLFLIMRYFDLDYSCSNDAGCSGGVGGVVVVVLDIGDVLIVGNHDGSCSAYNLVHC